MKNNNLTIIALLFVMIFCTGIVSAVEDSNTLKVKNLLRQKFEQSRQHGKNHGKPVNISDQDFVQVDPHDILNFLKPYETDGDYLVKRHAFQLEMRLAALHKQDITLRQKITKGLIQAHLDPNKALSPHPYRHLLTFTQKDFDSQTKAIILGELSKKHPDKKIIRICAVANITEALPTLETLLIDEKEYQAQTHRKGRTKWYYKQAWAARLARARMGVQEDINKCIELVDSQKDKGLSSLSLLHDIGYIRQPAAINFLKNYINSDERLSPVKSTDPGEPVASYVIDILADALRDFPVEKKPGRGYKEQDIQLCRQWMSQQTKWKIVR